MYRLHNVGMEKKIDYLVKKGYFINKEIVIVLWNEDSIKMKKYLEDKWNIKINLIMDDEVARYNDKVHELNCADTLKQDDSYLYLLAGNDCEVEKVESILITIGISIESIIIIKGSPLRAQDALVKCLEDPKIQSVLDVGCGRGNAANIFAECGKEVTGIDFEKSDKLSQKCKFELLIGDFEVYEFEKKYDLVWASHILEHQLEIKTFINKLFEVCKDGGKVAITVPESQPSGRVMAGHVTLWNAGMLLYCIIASGYDCRHAAVKTYAGNVSVIVPKERIDYKGDYRDVSKLKEYFPKGLDMGANLWGDIQFDGNIKELNWENEV